MKGKSVWNRPPLKRTDAYNLLLDLNGEARWKDLKANLKTLGWGPTTLKQTLDELIEEGSVIKEARLGASGPEVWYIARVKGVDPLEQLLGPRRKGDMSKIREAKKVFNTEVRQLGWQDDDEEWRVFAKRIWRAGIETSIELYERTYLSFIVEMANARRVLKKDAAMRVFDYMFNRTFDRKFKDDLRKEMEEIFFDIPAGLSVDVVTNLLKDAVKDILKEKFSDVIGDVHPRPG